MPEKERGEKERDKSKEGVKESTEKTPPPLSRDQLEALRKKLRKKWH